MSKTVYVEVTSDYSRSTWDDLGSTTYNPGDRVDYFDGSRNRIFVCINSNNSTTEPQNNPTDWAPAGSEQYPFLLIDSTNNLRVIDNSEWTIHGTSSSTVNFLVEELGTWTLVGNAHVADAQGATIILGDGRYTWDYTTYAMWWPNNCTIQAKNKHKAYIITNCQYWGGNNVVWKDVVIYSSNSQNTIPGAYSAEYKHSLDSCLMTQETPWGNLSSLKQEPSTTTWTRAIYGTWGGGYIRNCTIDYQYRGPSFWIDLTSASKQGVFENNTFYARVKHSQYNAIYHARQSVFKNNIFYFKYLMDSHPSQNFASSIMSTEGVNTFYLENDSDVGGTLNNNIPGGVTIDPLFIDADNSNFSLRPSSPLIGGVKSQNPLSDKYPEGMWFDANHIPVSQTYNFSLDTGDGTNYTFSGDATGTDPAIVAETGDTLVFTNNTGGHPIGIEDPNGNVIATESNGTLSFSTLTEGTYRYVCQAPHPNMSNTITITRNVGSYDNPSNNLIAALSVSYILLIKKGTHALTQKVIDMPGADLKIIGESTEKSVLVFSGGGYGAGIDAGRAGDSSSLSFESLTFLWDGTQNAYGIILCNDLNVKSCIFAQTENHLNSASSTRGWFAGSNDAGKTAVIENSVIRGKSNNALVFGGDYQQNGFNKATISNCTMICNGVVANNFYGSGNNTGLASPQSFTLKNTVHVGFSGTELLNSSAPTIGGNNYYYNTGLSTGFLDGDLVSTEPPGFVSENDLRLRPNSPLIGGISSPGSTAQTGVFYVNLANGDDSNDGKTASNAFKTFTAAHTASIHLDTIVIVDEHVSLTARLSLPGGRKYKPLTHCTIDGNNIRAVEIYDTADVDTYVSDFDFINLRTGTASSDFGLINLISSSSNSLFVFAGCYIDGIIANQRTSAIGGTYSAGCRSARDGSLVKNCTLNVGWTSGGTSGGTSQGFVAIHHADLIGCTFYVKDVSPLGMTSLFLVGQGGVGSWSHGSPLGPVIVKDCIVHGNNRLSYTGESAGNGLDLGFVSNMGVTQSNLVIVESVERFLRLQTSNIRNVPCVYGACKIRNF